MRKAARTRPNHDFPCTITPHMSMTVMISQTTCLEQGPRRVGDAAPLMVPYTCTPWSPLHGPQKLYAMRLRSLTVRKGWDVKEALEKTGQKIERSAVLPNQYLTDLMPRGIPLQECRHPPIDIARLARFTT